MPFPTMPSAAADQVREQDRRHPERETLLLAAAGAAQVLGPDHGVTKALAKASITMAKADLWRASAEMPDFPAGAEGRTEQAPAAFGPGSRPVRNRHRAGGRLCGKVAR